MSRPAHSLTRHYSAALKKYLATHEEAGLEEAYQLGRKAVGDGVGVLEMARLHQQLLEESFAAELAASQRGPELEAAETFFLETLSPFEVTHRGFRETNVRLQQLITTLEKRNTDLATINKKLQNEITERRRTEAALRESEDHYRELFLKARQMEENLRIVSNQVLHTQEEERKRISRELHDEVGQALTAVSVTLAVLTNDSAALPDNLKRRLHEAQQLLTQTMDAAHNFARELRPAMLDELGILPALRTYLKSFATRTGVRVNLRGDPAAEKLDSSQKTVLFRVAQESLTNVARHAQASKVEIAIRKRQRGICMTVADDGRSFSYNPKQAAGPGQRLGLLGMQERVRLVNGEFSVTTGKNKGTTIEVFIPFAAQNATRPAPKGR